MKWTKKHTSYSCIGLLIIALGYLLYLKLRRFRHNIEDTIEITGDTATTNEMITPNAMYDTSKRGYRNNNPLNIRVSSNRWKGEIVPSQDGSFCQFQTMAYGFRAAMCCIRTYITKYNLKTIDEIIHRWAPWSDGNNPDRYAKSVISRWSNDFPGVDTIINYKDKNQMTKLVYAMAIVENGSEPVMSDCEIAFNLM